MLLLQELVQDPAILGTRKGVYTETLPDSPY